MREKGEKIMNMCRRNVNVKHAREYPEPRLAAGPQAMNNACHSLVNTHCTSRQGTCLKDPYRKVHI